MSTTYRGGLSKEEVQNRTQAEEIYKLGSNENPLGSSPAVAEAIRQVADTLGEYPPANDDTLRVALAETLGRGLTPANIVTGNSGCDVLDLLARAYLDDEAECIICPPAFPVYKLTAERQGATIINVDLLRPDFQCDIDGILAAANEKTRLVYLCNPNNPTGSTIRASEINRLVDNLPPETVIVYDEVYHHFNTAQEDPPDPYAYVLEGKNFLILHSFSKAYGMAGLRLGYGITTPEIIAKLSVFKRAYYLNRFAFEGGMAALADHDHIAKTIEVTLAGRDWLFGQLKELGLKVWPSQANFLLFESPKPPLELTDQLIEYGVIVRPAFGLPDCVRVSVGTPAGNQAFIAALTEILEA